METRFIKDLPVSYFSLDFIDIIISVLQRESYIIASWSAASERVEISLQFIDIKVLRNPSLQKNSFHSAFQMGIFIKHCADTLIGTSIVLHCIVSL